MLLASCHDVEGELTSYEMICEHIIVSDAQDVVLERIEPDPAIQQTPCPGQRVLYECYILVDSSSF